MANNNKVIVELGRVIKNRGEYNPDASPLVKYFEENIVQKQGNSYIAYPTALVNDGVLDGKYYLTRAPYNDDPQTPNAGWEVFASGKHNFKTGEDIEDVSIATDSDFTNPDATKRAKVPTVGAILDGLNDGIYDVSKRNPTAGPSSDGKFALEYILNNANTLIPTSWRHGGMTISFVDSSDNKYVQYRYMSDDTTTLATFTNPANWQGVDDVLTPGSDDLAKSGSVAKELYGVVYAGSVTGGTKILEGLLVPGEILHINAVGTITNGKPSTFRFKDSEGNDIGQDLTLDGQLKFSSNVYVPYNGYSIYVAYSDMTSFVVERQAGIKQSTERFNSVESKIDDVSQITGLYDKTFISYAGRYFQYPIHLLPGTYIAYNNTTGNGFSLKDSSGNNIKNIIASQLEIEFTISDAESSSITYIGSLYGAGSISIKSKITLDEQLSDIKTSIASETSRATNAENTINKNLFGVLYDDSIAISTKILEGQLIPNEILHIEAVGISNSARFRFKDNQNADISPDYTMNQDGTLTIDVTVPANGYSLYAAYDGFSSFKVVRNSAIRPSLDKCLNETKEIKPIEQTIGIYEETFIGYAGRYTAYNISLEKGKYIAINTTGTGCTLRDSENNVLVTIWQSSVPFEFEVTAELAEDICKLSGVYGNGSVTIKNAENRIDSNENGINSLDERVFAIEKQYNKKSPSNLFNRTYTYGKAYNSEGQIVNTPYYALTDSINVFGHDGEYISINSGVAITLNGYWVFEDKDGNKTCVLPEYRRCTIPNGSVSAILTIHCPNAVETDIDVSKVYINFGPVALANERGTNPIGNYLDNAHYIINEARFINQGANADTFYITSIQHDTDCYVRICGFEDRSISVLFRNSNGDFLLAEGRVDSTWRKVIVPKGTSTLTIRTTGQENVPEKRYYQIQIVDRLNDSDAIDAINTALSDAIIPPYPPRQTENFFNYPNFTVADIYAIYDNAMAKFPNYISKVNYGKDSSNTYDVFGYTICFCNDPVYTILITANQHGGSASGDPVMGAYINCKMLTDLIGTEGRHNEIINWVKGHVRICIMPAANPWGIDNKSRTNYNGVNIVRNFPVSDWNDIPSGEGTDNYKGVSPADQVETQYILQFIEDSNPDVIIDNHTLGGVDGQVDSNSGVFFIAFPNDKTSPRYYDYFQNTTGYYAKRDFALQIQMPETFYAHGALRDWTAENGYLGGLIEMQWRDNLDNEKGFTARMIEMSYFQLLSVFDYYRQTFKRT